MKIEKRRIGEIGVDGGAILACDPSYAENAKDNYISNGYQGGQLDFGVVVDSGYGDGCYEAYGVFIDREDGNGERCARLEVEFIPLSEEEKAMLEEGRLVTRS